MSRSDPNRIFSGVRRTQAGCWLYTGGVSSTGYGVVSVRGRSVGAHRLAYELRIGPVPKGQCVLHRCDVKRCINPNHLFLGTKGTNNTDRKQKGRNADRKGEKNTSAKLEPLDIARIKRRYATGRYSQTEVGEMFGISQQQVSSIVRGQGWPHLQERRAA